MGRIFLRCGRVHPDLPLAVQLPCQAEQRLKNAGVAIKMVRRNKKSRTMRWDFFPMGGSNVTQRIGGGDDSRYGLAREWL
jgi:hypothetical protein